MLLFIVEYIVGSILRLRNDGAHPLPIPITGKNCYADKLSDSTAA